jgi:hypothetical protein
MKIPKAIFPFAKKLSGTTAAMHLAVYAAIIWILLQARRQMKQTDGFQASTIYSQVHGTGLYSLFTWYTNTIVTRYVDGRYSGGQNTPTNLIYKLYPIDLRTGIIRSTPLDIATEVRLYNVNTPKFDSSSPEIPTVGFYLTTAQYSVTFSASTPIITYNNNTMATKYAIAGTSYSNMWFDTVIDKNGNPLPVVLSNPLNLDTVRREIIPMTVASTTPSIIPVSQILLPPGSIPTSAGEITPPLSSVAPSTQGIGGGTTGGVSSSATAGGDSGGLAWYWIVIIIIIVMTIYISLG